MTGRSHVLHMEGFGVRIGIFINVISKSPEKIFVFSKTFHALLLQIHNATQFEKQVNIYINYLEILKNTDYYFIDNK